MNFSQLETLVTMGKSDTLEFKIPTVQIIPALKILCAFLNGKGGSILIRVTDDKILVGQQVYDNTKIDEKNIFCK